MRKNFQRQLTPAKSLQIDWNLTGDDNWSGYLLGEKVCRVRRCDWSVNLLGKEIVGTFVNKCTEADGFSACEDTINQLILAKQLGVI